MAFRFSDKNRNLLIALLVLDALALLTAIWHHTQTPHGGQTAWYFFGFMVVCTVAFLLLAREGEEEEIIHGLPEEVRYGEDLTDDPDDETGG